MKRHVVFQYLSLYRCCQSHAREQSQACHMSFITSYRRQAKLITACGTELPAQRDAVAAQHPTGSIIGPGGFHTNSDVTLTFPHNNICRNNVNGEVTVRHNTWKLGLVF